MVRPDAWTTSQTRLRSAGSDATTYTSVDITRLRSLPMACSAVSRLASTWAACAAKSPGPTSVPSLSSGTDPESARALEFLRERAVPATVGAVEGAEVAVAGRTATPYDFTRQVNARTPVVFAFVLVLAFVLLVVAFRSLALPLVSIALNLLSIGAAYGVLVAVFQGGRLESLLDFNAYGGVVSWLPLFMFVILFGLSMDYHIFILSRIRERWAGSRGGPDGAHEAIVGGIAVSAGVVTSAAAIMVGVFSVFTTLSAIEYKMLGTGMAVAILIDATVVRGVLLPAALALLGERACTLPGRGGSAALRTRDKDPHAYESSTSRA